MDDPQSKVFFIYGSTLKAVAYHMPLDQWEKYADEVWAWSLKKVKELYREEKKPEEEDRPAPSKYASEAQVSRAYAIAKKNDWTNGQFRNLLQSEGVDPHEKPCKIPIVKYGFIIAAVQKADNAAKYTEVPNAK